MSENAGIWLRVSSGAQDEALQIPDTTRWADDHNYNVRKTYTLHGQSASKGKHQKMLDAMLADMRAGIIKVLVVWASNRIERRGAFSVFWLAEQVKQAGGRIEYVKDEYLNTTNEMSDVMLALAATKDKMYSKTLSDASVRTVTTIRGNGAFHGRIPWGFIVVGNKMNKRLVPTDEGRKFIPEIFNRVIKGESLDSIAAWLDSQTWGGVPFAYPRTWARTIGQHIHNSVYMGSQTNPDGKVIHQCEALVDAFTWQRANKALDLRPKRGPMKSENKALLAGAVYCDNCGAPMYKINCGNKRKDGTKTERCYYRCAGSGAQRKGCGTMILMETADAIAMVMLRKRLDTPVVERVLIPGRDWSAEIAAVEFRLSRLGMQGLSRDEFRVEQDRLWALEDDLRNRPVTEATWDEIKMPFTWLSVWESLPRRQRGAWLAENGFYIRADRTGLAMASDARIAA